MKNIRIGNDIACVWTISRNGQPEDFSNKNLQLYLLNQYGVKVDMDFTIEEGNNIKFTFYGKDQTTTGIYRCILVENKGEEGMNTVDSCDAFNLVSRGDFSCCSEIQEETIEMQSDIPDCTEDMCSNIVSGLKGEKGEQGDSAYQVWLSEGNEGTVEDFLASLKGEDGADGKSTYEIWLEQGNVGTEADFLETVHGVAGKIVSVEAKGLEAGEQPTVVNKGTETEAKFLFGIPKGDKGNTGERGTDGNGVYYTDNEYDTDQDVQIAEGDVQTFGKPLHKGDLIIEASENKRLFRVSALTYGEAEADGNAVADGNAAADSGKAVEAVCEYIGMLRGERGEKGDKGATGERGEKGDPFMIYKTYTSVEAMEADHGNEDVPMHGMVLIDTGDVEDADNAKLYMKVETGFVYITDLSGAQGIKGDRGFSFRTGAVASVSDGNAVFASVTPVEGLQEGDIIVGFNAELGCYGQLFRITDASTLTATDLGVSLRGAQGANGATGEEGLSIYHSSYEATPETTLIEVSTITVPEGHYVKAGDLIIANDTYSYLFYVVAMSPTAAEVEYKATLRGAKGSDATVTVDSELNEESTNPVQNKVVKEAFDEWDSAMERFNENVGNLNDIIQDIDEKFDRVGENLDNLKIILDTKEEEFDSLTENLDNLKQIIDAHDEDIYTLYNAVEAFAEMLEGRLDELTGYVESIEAIEHKVTVVDSMTPDGEGGNTGEFTLPNLNAPYLVKHVLYKVEPDEAELSNTFYFNMSVGNNALLNIDGNTVQHIDIEVSTLNQAQLTGDTNTIVIKKNDEILFKVSLNGINPDFGCRLRVLIINHEPYFSLDNLVNAFVSYNYLGDIEIPQEQAD